MTMVGATHWPPSHDDASSEPKTLLSELKRRRENKAKFLEGMKAAEQELADLDRAIAALEPPAQPVHPDELRPAPGAVEESRDQPCTCHPDDAPPVCQHKYAASECRAAWDADLPTADDVRGTLNDGWVRFFKHDWTPTRPDAEITVADLDKLATKATEEERAGLEIPEGFTKWEGGERPVGAKTPVQVLLRNGGLSDMWGAGQWDGHWDWAGTVGDGTDIIAYRIISTPDAEHPEQDASGDVLDEEPVSWNRDAVKLIIQSLVDDVGIPARSEHTLTTFDGEKLVIQNISDEDLYVSLPQPEVEAVDTPTPYAAAVQKGAITQDEANLLAEAKADLARDEQAKFFAEGMMADADRHAQDQRGIVEKIGGVLGFKREREDA